MNVKPLLGDVVKELRKDDFEKQSHFRSDRMINHDGEWFFCTREGPIQGPFVDQLEASYQLERYIAAAASDLAGELSLMPLEPMACT